MITLVLRGLINALAKTAIENLVLNDLEYNKVAGTLGWNKLGKGRKLGRPVGSITKDGYLQTTLKSTQVKVHHVVWFLERGYWPESLDHINKDKLDNRISNLREGNSINQHNRSMPLPSTGLVGAHWDKRKGKYKSSIKIKGDNIHLGYFESKAEAHQAYKKRKEEVLNVR